MAATSPYLNRPPRSLAEARRKTLQLDRRERDTILAALRLWQQALQQGQHLRLSADRALALLEIAEDSGEPRLGIEEIDALAERLNVD
jgi:hypothetical protein